MVFKTYESIDTNILLRLILRDIPHQFNQVVDLLKRPDVIYIASDIAIMEMVHVLEGTCSDRQEIASYVDTIMALLNVEMDRALYKQILPAYLEHPKLSFNDCYLAAKAAADESEPLWTFDRTLAKQSPTAKLLA